MTPAPRSTSRVLFLATAGGAVGALLAGAAILHHRATPAPTTYPDGGTGDAILRTAQTGPASGEWKVRDGDAERKFKIEDDPAAPDLLRETPEGGMTQLYPRSRVALGLVGYDPSLFLANYRPAAPARHDELDSRSVTVVTWMRADGATSAQRTTTVDDKTGEIVAVEDQAPDGHLLRCMRLTVSFSMTRRPNPPPTPREVEMTIDDLTRVARFPVYEPSRLPKGYRRVNAGYSAASLNFPECAWLRYGDGLGRFDLIEARPDQLESLVRIARRMQSSAPQQGCTTLSDEPEPILQDAILIKRRADHCRTVLQREDLPGVVVVLVGFNEIEGSLYLDSMRSLSKVDPAK